MSVRATRSGRLANRLRICGVGLPTLDKGLHVSRRHQLYSVPELIQLRHPMVRRCAGFHPDHARLKTRHERKQFPAGDARPAEGNPAREIWRWEVGMPAHRMNSDRVSQIRMESWSRGRVALAGDAAFCASLVAGQGSALAMISAYVLAGELANAGGRHEEAFGKYEAFLRAFINTKQHGAERLAAVFAPKTQWGQCLRNQVIRAFAIPGLARLVVGRDIIDTLRLPDYRWPSHYGSTA